MAVVLELKSGEECEAWGLQTAGYHILATSGTRTSRTRGWYDPIAHTYYLGGSPIVSVTQVLVQAGRIDATWFTEEARRRGLAVHDWTAHMDRGTWRDRPAPPMPESIAGYIEAYTAFKFDCRPRFAAIETAWWHPGERFGGRPDRLLHGMIGGEGGRFVLYLAKTGRYRLRRCREASDYAKFREDLTMVRDAVGYGAGV